MKRWFNEKYTHIALYVLGVILASLLFLFVVWNLNKLIAFLGFLLFSARSVVFGLLLALSLFPLCRLLENLLDTRVLRGRGKRFVRPLGVSLTFVILVIVISIIIVSVLPLLNQNYHDLSQTIEGYISGAVASLEENELVYNLFRALTGVTGGNANEIIEELIDRYSDLFSQLANSLITFLFEFVYSAADVLIALILAFYFLLSRDMIRGLFRKLMAAIFPRRFLLQSARVFRMGYTNMIEFFSARLTCSFILGVLCYFFAWLMGVPFYPLISLIAMVLNIFPVLGPIAATLLCTLIAFLLKPPVTLPFLLLFIVLNVLEQFLVEKYLLSKRLRPNVALALVLVIVAYLIGGAWAVVLIIPVFVTVQNEMQIFLARRLTKKGYSLDTGDYISPEGAEIYMEAPHEEPPAAETEETASDDTN